MKIRVKDMLSLLLNEAQHATTETSLPRKRIEWLRREWLEPLKKTYE